MPKHWSARHTAAEPCNLQVRSHMGITSLAHGISLFNWAFDVWAKKKGSKEEVDQLGPKSKNKKEEEDEEDGSESSE